jgi:hypothetical protein
MAHHVHTEMGTRHKRFQLPLCCVVDETAGGGIGSDANDIDATSTRPSPQEVAEVGRYIATHSQKLGGHTTIVRTLPAGCDQNFTVRSRTAATMGQISLARVDCPQLLQGVEHDTTPWMPPDKRNRLTQATGGVDQWRAEGHYWDNMRPNRLPCPH